MRAARYARGLNKGIFWLISLALLLALALPSDGTGVVQASPDPDTVILRPAGAGNETNLDIGGTSPAATNWESVDDEISDGDETYVQSTGTKIGVSDLYTLSNPSHDGTVNSVTVYIRARAVSEPTVLVDAKTEIKVANYTAREGDPITLTTSYADYYTPYLKNPDTEEEWSWEDIDNLQAGVNLADSKREGPMGDRRSYCTQVWVVVDYTPPLSSAIEIRAQDYETAVTNITFPEAAPGAVVSNPYNDQGETQTFGNPAESNPVVTLCNNSTDAYTIWYNITPFTEGIVANEYYLINVKNDACADEFAITNAVTFDTSTNTATTIAAGAEKDLYLKITLSEVAGKSGTSTLTILGETV